MPTETQANGSQVRMANPLADAVSLRRAGPVSIIIPAHRAGRTLPLCLEGVRRSVPDCPVEVIIVYDGSEPQGLAGTAGGVIVRELRSPVRGSAAAARNLGAAGHAEGILVFLDADVVVDPHTLAAVLAPVAAGAAEAAVGNYSRDTRGLAFFQKYKQLYIATVYGRRRGSLRNEFWTAIGAIRADVFHRLGGFDERIPGACGEDTELGQRLTAGGHRILAVPEGTGRHLHQVTLRGLLRNDLIKGTLTVFHSLRGGHSVTDNRHSSHADILAVGCAALATLVALAGVVTPLVVTASVPLLAIWAWGRKDILGTFAREGVGFLVRALLLAWLLDLVRGVCVVAGVLRYVRESRRESIAISRQARPCIK